MSHQLIVAIGRESGSGGLDIAHALAERLQLPLFDKSILQKAAEDKGVSAETLERYDERPYSPLFCRSVRGISSAPEDCVAQMQFELLRQHANAGESFVVLGRCAEEVLADREGTDIHLRPGGSGFPGQAHPSAGGGSLGLHQASGPAAADLP